MRLPFFTIIYIRIKFPNRLNNALMQDQLKKIQQKRLSLSSDKILMYVNSSRESYSIFQRFREDAITKKTKVSNRSVFEK